MEILLSIMLVVVFFVLPFFIWRLWQRLKTNYSVEMEKLSKIGCFFIFVVWSLLGGAGISEIGPWFIIFGWLFGIPLWYSFSKLLNGDKWWIGAYITFFVCSFFWVFDLSGWTDSHGSTSSTGLYFFAVASYIILLIGLTASKYPCSKLIASIILVTCIVGTSQESVIAPKLFCPQEKPLLSRGECYACDEIKTLMSDESRCSICGNMRRMYNSDWCILNTCPSSHPLRDSYQSCTQVCPVDKPVRSSTRGDCYACDSLDPVYNSDEESCNKCGGVRIMWNGSCILAKCPQDKPLRLDGKCVSCTENRAIKNINDAQCAQCDDRIMTGDSCVLKECPATHPLRTDAGDCRACNYSWEFDTTEEECFACAKTHVYISRDHKCVEKQMAAYREKLYQNQLKRQSRY